MTPPRCLLTLVVLLGTLAQPLPADIYRWDTDAGDSRQGKRFSWSRVLTLALGSTGPTLTSATAISRGAQPLQPRLSHSLVLDQCPSEGGDLTNGTLILT